MIKYQITLQPNQHSYLVVMQFVATHKMHTLKLPTWIPGSYMIREFSKNIIQVGANISGTNSEIACQQIDKNTWHLSDIKVGTAIEVTYTVHANQPGIRTSYLDTIYGYFNNTSLCLYLLGMEQEIHTIEIKSLPINWQIATSLMANCTANNNTQESIHTFSADNYNMLIDSPVVLGNLHKYDFNVQNLAITLVLSGIIINNFDSERFIADIAKICRAHIDLFAGAAPCSHYTFLLHLSGEIYTGLEHSYSSLLAAPYYSLPTLADAKNTTTTSTKIKPDYLKLLGLISHEFFHAWNVKRIKPQAFVPYNLEQENYTTLLWWFEGVTSYYDDLLLYRAGLINQTEYLTIVTENINNVYKFNGAKVQSLANASLTSWIKYYRPDENSPNSTVSYYIKGALAAMCLDLLIRSNNNNKSLDDVMRGLYSKWQRDGFGINENELADLIVEFGACNIKPQIEEFTHSCTPLPYSQLLARFGVNAHSIEHQAEHSSGKVITTLDELPKHSNCDLGCKLTKIESGGYKIVYVYSGSAAEDAGLAADDLLIAFDNIKLSNYDKQIALYHENDIIVATIFRGEQMLHCNIKLQYPKGTTTYLQITDNSKLDNWL